MFRRRLIIISNTGGQGNYCGSVVYDYDNYLSFFQSPEGGYWNKDTEIIDFRVNECSFNELEQRIRKELSEGEVFYWLVVFAGHGWENNKYDTRLELHPCSDIRNDISINWFREKFAESRCLLIADCCRVKCDLLVENRIYCKKQMFSHCQDSESYKKQCLELYNNQIRKLSKGLFQIGYAASFGQGADNRIEDDGGLYSYNILNEAKKQIDKNKSEESSRNTVISFSYIHSLAKTEVIQQSKGKQIPQLIYERGYQPPFCVIPKREFNS